MCDINRNPGACSVSTKCYLPNELVEQWILPRLANSSNLKVLLRAVVKNTTRSPTGEIQSLSIVQRKAKAPIPEWSHRLSDVLEDWYSPSESPYFSKEEIEISAKVFIEATELGDVLATSGLPFAQGLEYPLENSTKYENCGQAQTLTFYMTLLQSPEVAPPLVPAGGDEGIAFPSAEALTKGAPGK